MVRKNQKMTHKSPKVSQYRPVIAKILNRLAEAEQPLPRSVELYHRILTLQDDFKLPDLTRLISRLETGAKQSLEQGEPIVSFSDLPVDWESTLELYSAIVDLAVEFLSPCQEEIEKLKQTGSDTATLSTACKDWFESTTVAGQNEGTRQAMSSLVSSVFQAVLYPLLSSMAERLMPGISKEFWHKNYCHVCGGSPDFSYLDKESDGMRWLLCSRCDAAWSFYRLVCPFCGNDDQQSLAYYADESGTYRLYVCEKCKRYLKAIDLRKTEAEIMMPLERILTLDMDRQALDQNYKNE
jgi:FdhE protein